MTKAEMIVAVAEKAGMTKKDAEKAVAAVLETVTETLKKGDKITLTGFGSFEVKTRAAHAGINPKTRKPITIAEFVKGIGKFNKLSEADLAELQKTADERYELIKRLCGV